MNLSKKVFGSNVDRKIRNYFKQLQRGSFSANESALSVELNPPYVHEPINYSDPDYTFYLGDRTTYARMWTAVNISEPNKEDKGKNILYVINDNSSDSYGEELGSVKNLYQKPAAGITSVNSKSEGSVGALRRTTVEFIVHNKEEFDTIFLPFFLKPGSQVFVDFGWSDKALSLYDPNKFINNKDLDLSNLFKELYEKKDKEKGLTTTLNGQVLKYDVSVDQNQSFRCTLEFVSRNYHLLDKEVSDDNKLKFVFQNQFEELILGYYLNSISGSGGDNFQEDILDVDNEYGIPAEERKKQVSDFIESGSLSVSGKTGKISDSAKKIGISFQSFQEQRLSEKETLYISYALFEDKFLNNFISYWDNDGTPDKNVDLPSFSSKNSYVRWDKRLNEMMSIEPQTSEELTSFLYPDSWNVGETSNKFKPNQNLYEGGYPGNNEITEHNKARRKIPLRELFISVPLISEAFSRSTNVNDALEFIFDKIYQDSGNIINIKFIQNTESEASLTFYDTNLQPTIASSDEILKFDLTSGDSVVQNVDLKFETPKAGLSSMIAIGGLSEPQIFDELELMKFNLLNALQSSGKKQQVRHLPILGDIKEKEVGIDVNINNILKGAEVKLVVNNTDNNIGDRYKNFKKSYDEKVKKLEEKGIRSRRTPTRITKNTDDVLTFTVDTEREKKLTFAKIKNFIISDDNSISPVLPISLTLEVYGNNFLSIGDYFTVNFLPKHWQERIYFQIVGVDHSVGTSNWKTTYTTVMRIKSSEKFYHLVSNKTDQPKENVNYRIQLSSEAFKQIMQKDFPKGYYTEYLEDILVNTEEGETIIYRQPNININVINRTLFLNFGLRLGQFEKPGEEPLLVGDIFESIDKNEQEKIERLNSRGYINETVYAINTKGSYFNFYLLNVISKNLSRFGLAYRLTLTEMMLDTKFFRWEQYIKEVGNVNYYFLKEERELFGSSEFKKPALTDISFTPHKVSRDNYSERFEKNIALSFFMNTYHNNNNNDQVYELLNNFLNGIFSKQKVVLGKFFKLVQPSNIIGPTSFPRYNSEESGILFLDCLSWSEAKKETDDKGVPYQIIKFDGMEGSDLFPPIVFPKKYFENIKAFTDAFIEKYYQYLNSVPEVPRTIGDNIDNLSGINTI
tara:strand:- start:66 stop:3470 length:3405 start_codon:yes stop_codon:yes gene_type:complete